MPSELLTLCFYTSYQQTNDYEDFGNRIIVTQMAMTPMAAVALQNSGKLKNNVFTNSYMLQSCVLEKDSEKDVRKRSTV